MKFADCGGSVNVLSERDWVLHSLNPVTETFGKRYVTSPCLLKAEGPVHLLLMDVLVTLFIFVGC